MSSAAAVLEKSYGVEPSTTLRAPGRVNLIGEHTDYSLLPVLPMAINLGTDIAAVAADDDRVLVTSAKYPFRIEVRTTDLTQPSDWGVYLHGALSVLGDRIVGKGARIGVSGDLPDTGGLSSSSALTVGLLAVLNDVWELGLGEWDIVDLSIVAERTIGVESGGMDQTVIAMATDGAALRIDFDPRSLRPVPIPAGVAFVIGYSGTEAAKAQAAKAHYNRAVVACRSAAALLADAVGREAGDPPSLGRVAGFVTAMDIESLPVQSTPSAAAELAGIDPAQLISLTGGTFSLDEPISVRSAAQHVLAEATRVHNAEAALLAEDMESVGRLFDQSHASLRQFGAVTPGLDLVTAAARDAGALGARVTGAGFGGWAVALCTEDAPERVASAMATATGGPAFRVFPSGGAL